MSNIDQDKLDKIVRGQLPMEASELSLDEIQELKTLEIIRESIRYNTLKENKVIIDNLESAYINNNSSKIMKITWLKSVAAVLVVLVAATLIFRLNSSEFNPEDYIIHDTLRSEENTKYSNKQLQAYNLFVLEDYTSAIPILKELSKNTKDTVSIYYLTLSYYATEDIESFNSTKKDPRIKNFKLPNR